MPNSDDPESIQSSGEDRGAAGMALSIQPDASEKPITLYRKSFALVVGIDNYTNGWRRLNNAVKDAEAIADALSKQGFDVRFEKDLDGGPLTQVFQEWFLLCGQDEDVRLLVWFAGHGHSIDKPGGGTPNGYIVGADAPDPMAVPAEQRRQAELEFRRRSLSLARFGEYMREVNARHVLVIFDSCFSGGVFSAVRSSPPAISRATALPVRQFITAGTAGQTVSDDSMFRRLFIGAITGQEPDADANRDGYLTANELGIFLQQKVTNLTHNRQTPDYGSLREEGFDRGDFVFEINARHATGDLAAGLRTAGLPMVWESFDPNKMHCVVVVSEHEQKTQPAWGIRQLVDEATTKYRERIWRAFVAACNGRTFAAAKPTPIRRIFGQSLKRRQ